MANIIPVGIFIGFIHDVSDILVSASKGFHLAGYSTTSVITFLAANIIWFTMRLMALPQLFYSSSICGTLIIERTYSPI